jgi:hypothetical protein
MAALRGVRESNNDQCEKCSNFWPRRSYWLKTVKSDRLLGNRQMAAKKKRSKDTPEQQHARFVEAAEKAEADEAPDAMDKAFKKLALANKSKTGSR